jgi:hypothetical protein
MFRAGFAWKGQGLNPVALSSKSLDLITFPVRFTLCISRSEEFIRIACLLPAFGSVSLELSINVTVWLECFYLAIQDGSSSRPYALGSEDILTLTLL